MNLKEQILYIIKSATGVEATPDTILRDLPMDSLDFVELSFILEKKYDFKASPKQWDTLWYQNGHTVSDLIELINSNLNKPNPIATI